MSEKERKPCVLIYQDGQVEYSGVSFEIAMYLLHRAYLYEDERYRAFCRQCIERSNADGKK